jgi:ribosomal protein S18 acetylase RimI-like enzyme
MNIARLLPMDAMQYRKLMLEAYELAADAFTSTAEERSAEPESFWITRIADPSGMSAAFGAFERQELVGTVALEFSAKPKTKHKGLVIGMYVAPAARGKGAGGALLDAAVQFARCRDGMALLTLTVSDGNAPAIHLYRAAGFEVFGTEPMAILTPSGYKAKVHMWLALSRTAAGSSF